MFWDKQKENNSTTYIQSQIDGLRYELNSNIKRISERIEKLEARPIELVVKEIPSPEIRQIVLENKPEKETEIKRLGMMLVSGIKGQEYKDTLAKLQELKKS